jgi:hypothetical protein
VSVDTYLKGKDTTGYQRVCHDDVEVLVAPSMARWARTVRLTARGGWLRRALDVDLEHEHGPTCRH